MIKTLRSIVEQPDERGSALIGVLLLLMMMSALAAALGVSGQTETLISRNQRSGAQAQVAAEAGLNHAVELATTYIFDWKANGFGDADEAVDALLAGPDQASGTEKTDADNGSLDERVGITEAEAIPLATRLTIADGVDAEYEAFVMDDDNAPDEDGDPLNDTNRRLVIRAVGYAENATSVVLEAVVAPLPLPAIVSNGDFEISGHPEIGGTKGSVHSNANLTISGHPTISGNVSASDSYDGSGKPTILGTTTEGAAELPVLEVRASDYRAWADFILTSTGQLTYPDGVLICDASEKKNACKDDYGWEFKGNKDIDKGWDFKLKGANDGTFYVESPVKISGDVKKAEGLVLSVIAEGGIEISGHAEITPDTDVWFVTDGDLKISGHIEMDTSAPEVRVLVHEQLHISGHASIAGQIMVENAASVDDLINDKKDNSISGHAIITYSGNLSTGVFVVTGWRDVR